MPLNEQEINLLNKIHPVSLRYAEKLTLLNKMADILSLLEVTVALSIELGGSSVKQLEA